jgi:hypothetical protein
MHVLSRPVPRQRKRVDYNPAAYKTVTRSQVCETAASV